MFLNDACALDKHAAGAAGRVQHRAALRIKNMGNQRDQRDGSEELARVVSLLVGELREEVLVDAAEDVTRDPLQLIGIERAQRSPRTLLSSSWYSLLGRTPRRFS